MCCAESDHLLSSRVNGVSFVSRQSVGGGRRGLRGRIALRGPRVLLTWRPDTPLLITITVTNHLYHKQY